MISFSNPTAFFLLILAVPIIALYLKRPGSRQVSVSSGMFWTAFESEAAESKWQTLRHPVSLFTQLLLLGMLILAAAKPAWTTGDLSPQTTVIVLDNSASMKAVDVRPNRFEFSKARARDRLRSAHDGDRVAVLTVIPSGTPSQLTNDALQAEEWLNTVVATDIPESPEIMNHLVHQLRRIEDSAHIVVYSDNPKIASHLSEQLNAFPNSEAPLIESQTANRSGRNIGITSFQVRRDSASAPEMTVTLEIANASELDGRMTLTAQLTADSSVEELDRQIVTLKPEERRQFTLNLKSMSGGILTVTLSEFTEATLNCLITDDTASATIDAADPVNVLVVSQNLFLRESIAAVPWTRPVYIEAMPADLSATISATQTRIVVLDSSADVLEERPADAINAGFPRIPMIIVGPQSTTEHWQIGPTVNAALPDPAGSDSEWYSDAGWFSGLSGEETTFHEIREIQFLHPHRVLVGGLTEFGRPVPLIAAFEHNDIPCMVLNMNLSKTDFVFRTAFPVVIQRLVSEVGDRSEGGVSQISSGTITAISSEAAAHLMKSPAIIAPNGMKSIQARWLRPFNDTNERWADLGPFEQTGVWRLQRDRKDATSGQQVPSKREFLCVNLNSVEESDLRRSDPSETENSSTAAAAESSTTLFTVLCLCATISMCVEWTLFQRQLIQ